MTKILWPHKYMGGTNTWKGLNINSWPINHHSLCISSAMSFAYSYIIFLMHIIFLCPVLLKTLYNEHLPLQTLGESEYLLTMSWKAIPWISIFSTTFGVFWPNNQSWMRLNECFSDGLHAVYFSLFILEKTFG